VNSSWRKKSTCESWKRLLFMLLLDYSCFRWSAPEQKLLLRLLLLCCPSSPRLGSSDLSLRSLDSSSFFRFACSPMSPSLSDEEKGLLAPPPVVGEPTTYLLHPGRRRPPRRSPREEQEEESEDDSTTSEDSDEDEDEVQEERVGLHSSSTRLSLISVSLSQPLRRRPPDPTSRRNERWVIAFVVFLILFAVGGWAAKTYIDKTASEGSAESSTVAATAEITSAEAPKSSSAPTSSKAASGEPSQISLKEKRVTDPSQTTEAALSTSTKATSAQESNTSPSKTASGTASGATSTSTGTTSTGSGAGMFGVTDDVCGDSGAVCRAALPASATQLISSPLAGGRARTWRRAQRSSNMAQV